MSRGCGCGEATLPRFSIMFFLPIHSSWTIFLIILVDCTWNSWSAWETCSISCGNGTQERNRTKNAAQHGGADCVGSDTESQFCNTNPCPGLVYFFLANPLILSYHFDHPSRLYLEFMECMGNLLCKLRQWHPREEQN